MSQYGHQLKSLTDAGAIYKKDKDIYGDTRCGWWIDNIWLSESAIEAEKIINGES